MTGGSLAVSSRLPATVVAYVQAAATLWDHGLRPLGIFGSHHDGASVDPAKAGEADLAVLRSFGGGGALDLEGLLATAPDLVVAVSYGGGQLYGVDPEAAKHLEEQVPVVVLEVGKDRSLDSIRDRFTELAGSLRAPGAPATAELERARARLTGLTGRSDPPRIVALSAANCETAYVARPSTWPDLRAVTALGVELIEPDQSPGVNWHTADWSEVAALEPDIVLSDVRLNAAPRARLLGNAHWRGLEERARTLPWNPEAPCSHRGHARFLDTIAEAMAR